MGMTRLVGLAFLLLLVVSHATEQSEAEKRNAILGSLLPNQYYIASHQQNIIRDVDVGSPLVLVFNGEENGRSWTFLRADGFIIAGPLTSFWTSSDYSVQSLTSLEVIPTRGGEYWLRLMRSSWTDEEVRVFASQGSRIFLEPFYGILPDRLRDQHSSVTSTANRELTFIFEDISDNSMEWRLESSSGLTPNAIEPTPFELTGYRYWHAARGNPTTDRPWKQVRVTPTIDGSYELRIKLIKKSDESNVASYIIKMEIETITETITETSTETITETTTEIAT